MTETLLEELTQNDIDWLVSVGQKKELSPEETLVEQHEPLEQLYILLEGQLTSVIRDDPESAMGRAYSALMSESSSQQELFSYSEGEILGESSVLWTTTSPVTVQAKTKSVVLTVPREELQAQLRHDSQFGARFYRAIAILLLNRYEFLLDQFLNRKRLQVAPIQDGPILFGELYDSDIDWMVTNGEVQFKKAETSLIQAGRPADTLYIVLKGLLSIKVMEKKASTLNKVFAQLASSEPDSEAPSGKEIARASQGEVVGETTLVDSRLSKFAVSTVEDSVLLAIPRRELLIQLQQHAAMSSRFYRVLTILLSERLAGLISRLGYGKRSYQSGQSLSSDVTYEDEADLEAIDNLTLGGNRFDWMLKRLKVERT